VFSNPSGRRSGRDTRRACVRRSPQATRGQGLRAHSRRGGVVGSLELGLRLGLGLEALLGDSGDGLIFLQAGITLQSRSSGGRDPNCPADPLLAQFVPGIPARSGLSFRFRAPFWLIPGDLLLATPVLAFTSPDTLKKMAITAADGGLIPWQTKIATPVGRVQFMAGREIGATLFGFAGDKDAMLVPNGEGSYTAVALRSIKRDIPLVEYRSFREYGTRFSFAAFLQFGLGIDQPMSAEVVFRPDAPLPPLKTRYFGFLRIFFDGRRYF
jgi:hypothetical protein